MKDEYLPFDARTVFAAFALHKLLAGMEDPEEHFSQIEDSYSDLCAQAWRISERMMEVRGLAGSERATVVPEEKEGG